MPSSTWGLSTKQRAALSAASGILLTALYPPFSLSPLGWIALAPLLVALDDVSPRAGFALGWLAGTIGSLAVTGYWIYRAAFEYFHVAPLAAVGFTIAVTQVLGGLYFGLFGFAAASLGARRSRWWLTPAIFVAVEYLRSRASIGGPWELLGHSQDGPLLRQLCDLTGVYGISFVLALSAAGLVEVPRRRRPLGVAALVAAAVSGYGAWRIAALPPPHASLQIALVQGNLANAQRGRPEYFSAHVDRYVELTRRAAQPAPDLVVWPENAVGFFPAENPELLARLTAVLTGGDAALLVGAPRAAGSGGVAALYNAAFLLTREGIRGTYDKRVLLPLVERTPLRPQDGPYAAGQEATVFALSHTRFGVLICFEAIYPELARELVGRGAQVLVNISNDSWFDAGWGPEQHYEIARFRAVENRVSFVRVANSGISAVIDPMGREIARLPAQQAAAMSVAVPIGPGDSFYSRHGDVFALACVAVALVGLIRPRLGRMPK